MPISTVDRPQFAAPRSRRSPLRLDRTARRVLLITHIVAAGAWIGIDVLVGVLVVAGRTSDDAATRALAAEALARFVVWPMLSAALVCLVSGVALGLGTKWGLIRYWWVSVKLVMNVVLCTLILVLLTPSASALSGEAVVPADMIFPPAVSLTALLIATTLSVFKPWGRTRTAADPRA